MKTNVIFFLVMMLLVLNGFTQSRNITLTFTATNEGDYVPLDSIRVVNLDKDADTVLYWPDTVLNLVLTGVDELPDPNGFSVTQNYPNPINRNTSFKIILPQKDLISIRISDLQGRSVAVFERTLGQGEHTFTFYPNNEKMFVMIIAGSYGNKTVKMANTSGGISVRPRLIYNGLKIPHQPLKSMNRSRSFPFEPGDPLRFVGYALTLFEVNGSDVFDRYVFESGDFEFKIINGVPCRGIEFFEFKEQVYSTVQIKMQCWMKENMNWEIPYSWCYNNDPDKCAIYGRLYDWYSALQACPSGWRIPSDEEWKILEGTADSYYSVGDPIWDIWGFRGFDVNLNLKSDSGWYDDDNGLDLFGFTALPGGYRGWDGHYYGLEESGCIWSSTEYYSTMAWWRWLTGTEDNVYRGAAEFEHGFSVRCIRD